MRQTLPLLLITLYSQFCLSQTLLFTCASTPDMPDFQYAETIISSAAAKLGYNINMQHASADEVKAFNKKGSLAGDCGRFKHAKSLLGFEDTTFITPAFRRVDFSLWKRPDVPPPKQSRIGFIDTAATLEGLLNSKHFPNITAYSNVDRLLEDLKQGAIDYVAVWDAIMFHRKSELLSSNIKHHSYISFVPAHIVVSNSYPDLQEEIVREVESRRKRNNYYSQVTERIPKQIAGKIIFACSASPDSDTFKTVEKVYLKTFNSIGYQFEMFHLPRARALEELKSGRIDGDCARVFLASDSHQNLLKVPVKVASLSISYWGLSLNKASSDQKIDITPTTRFAYIRGTKVIEEKLPDDLKNQAQTITYMEQGFKMLSAKRIDYLLATDLLVRDSLKQSSLTTPLFKVAHFHKADYYPVLHKKHEALIPQIQNMLSKYFANL